MCRKVENGHGDAGRSYIAKGGKSHLAQSILDFSIYGDACEILGIFIAQQFTVEPSTLDSDSVAKS